ncbi:hypothetical protein BaRGS_00025179, partial [Batillaria attramentaria]
LCCYRSGSFITNAPDAGSCTAYNPAFTYMYADYLHEDKLGYQACCKDSSSDGLCEAFYALRPTGDCASETFYRADTIGDPHIITFDEKNYVFNGWGEYTMMTLNTPDVNFTLQGRTDLAETESGQLCNATVFAAFGAEENGVRMFVGLDPGNKSSLIIYANGTDYSFQFQNNTDFLVDTEDFQLARDINVLYASFPSGISIGVSVRIKSLAVSVSLPLAFQGQTLGLLGNNNGKKEDDLVLPDGTMLPNNLTERQIFEQFGKKWQVSQSDSVMRYGPREGPANYTHPDFMPIFLDEQPADVRKGAEAVCGPSNFPCIYDYFATGSSAFALDSKQVKDEADETNVLIRHDDDNDEITYHVEEDGTGAVQIDSITGRVRFVPDALQPFVARFFVKDSHNVPSPALSPIIIICSGCSGHGSCDYSRYSFADRGNYNFQFAACVCEPSWDGLDCEKDRDGCIGNPCLEQQTCTDLTPDQQGGSSVGYDCGPCPEGYRTDPVSQNCVDVDECSMDKCEMDCFNTAGTYACSCNAGYRLDNNGHTCWDINECREKTDNCEQICTNTLGSYECQCEEGYTLDSSGTKCLQDKETASVCRNAGCSQGCKKSSDGIASQCFCRPGYDLDLTDNKTCVDHDDVPGWDLLATVLQFRRRYGSDCELTCRCEGRGTGCHPVTGCVCEDGWSGAHCEDDVDECSRIPSVCGDNQLCINTQGSYACGCPDGYTLTSEGTACTDIDECEEDSLLSTCGSLERCVNVPGTFYCECLRGFRRTDNECTDIDECASSKNDCEQICVNVPGTYNCECYYGYRLNMDRATLSDVCAEQGLACTHGCTLSDVDDRAFCFCRTGYQLDSDQQTCVDIDECSTNVCDQQCENSPGSYRCLCNKGFTLNSRTGTCEASASCRRKDCPTQNGGCSEEKCFCNNGYTLTSDHNNCLLTDVDWCAVAQCGHDCEETRDGKSFICSCRPGYLLQNDGTSCEGQKTVKVSFILEGVIVEQADLSDTNSESYSLWSRSATQALDRWLRPKVRGFVSVTILALRVGSLVIDTEIVVDETNSDAVPTLSMALLDLAGDSLAVNNQMGNVKVAINDVDAEDNTLTIVLAIVISLIVIIAIIVIVLYILKRRKKKSATITDTCEEDPGAKSGKGASDNDNLTEIIATEDHNALLSTMPDPPRQSSGNIPGQFPNPLFEPAQHPPEKLDSSEASPADRPHSASSNVSATGGTDGRDTTMTQATGENTTSAIGTDQKSETDP